MTVDKLDLQFAAITWMVNQNINSLNEQEKVLIETLFTQYCDYARGSKSAEERVQYLLDIIVGKARIVEEPQESIINFPRQQAVFAMAGGSDNEVEDEEEKSDVKSIKRIRQKIQKTKLLQRISSKAPPDTTQEQMLKMLTVIAQGQHESRQMSEANLEHMAKFAESTEANRIALELQIHNLEKDNIIMQKRLQELYDMQIRQQSLTDLKWHQIPDWFREIYAGGIKRVSVGLVKLPFRIAGIAVDRIIYRPMVRAYDFWGGKVELVVGTVLWIIVIAGVIHIYQVTDWEMVNNTYKKYGGELIDKYMFLGIDLLKTVPELFPKSSEVSRSVGKFFFEKCVDPIVQMVYMFWQAILALLTSVANATLSKMPGSSYWFTPADVTWPNSALFNYIRDFWSNMKQIDVTA